ncbi:asparagine synthase (glutamine-hydrolyzing) [Oleiharenicola lentus]|uniref:asparagine synthase (glutamine-hydrolyzing) n=1 Tax=Oleiharenicola lentus TaxID=2508720 RepID=A0A4Q1CA09_9BACT|nr:asparagine synthase (glutamine-hydrolyzing) [Oleiharenicola lentus]RXK55720.1 asparagine synthase (glutamine-hydrolyzing) [Oleiharenicola lentus]
MCGIAGTFRLNEESRQDLAVDLARIMIRRLAHRGPDGIGDFADERACLAHARLSIIDLEGGAQPLFNEEGNLALVFNGEIYGYKQLQAELAKTHVLRTQSDSEVLLHLYEDLGFRMHERLNGMYAFALYNRQSGEFYAANDGAGIKPLYYAVRNGILLFASEIRAIVEALRAGRMECEADLEAARSYLLNGWIPPPYSLLKGVRKLPPGGFLRVRDGRVESGVHRAKTPVAVLGNAAAVSSLEAQLTAVIEDQLVADVPVGLFLSGGIDSSLLLALTPAARRKELSTFTIGFAGNTAEVRRSNEADYARDVAAHFGTQHHTEYMAAQDLLQLLDAGLDAMDEPIADPAILPLLRMSTFARAKVKVCLSGDGGDELFGGYLRFRTLRARQWVQALHAGAPLLAMRRVMGLGMMGRSAVCGRMRSLLGHLSDPRFFSGPIDPKHVRYLEQPLPAGFRSKHVADVARSTIEEEIEGQLAGQLLPKTDRITMWTGLEVRVPFLDDRMIDYARRLPPAGMATLTRGKMPLRDILSRHLPARLAMREKHGFRVPLAGWFRHELRSELEGRLRDGRHFPVQLLPVNHLTEILDAHLGETRDESYFLWAAFALESWFRRHGVSCH